MSGQRAGGAHGAGSAADPVVADFFIVRVPLLARDVLEAWSAGLRAGQAVQSDPGTLAAALDWDRAVLRRRLAGLLDDEQIACALQVASPDLDHGLDRWRADPDAPRGRSAERSLVRYLTRMATRPGLFGLAGGYLLGTVGGEPALEVGARRDLVVAARVDPGLLRAAVRQVLAGVAAGDELVVRPNPGMYRVAGRLRVPVRVAGESKHRLVAVRPSDGIDAVLRAAGPGAPTGELARGLQEQGMTADAARALVGRLVATELLIPAAQLAVTGDDPAAQALGALRSLPGGGDLAGAVERASRRLCGGWQHGRETIQAVAGEFERLGVKASRRRCIQLDARRTGTAVLPEVVLAEMARAAALLVRIAPREPGVLSVFRERFEQRFGTRPVPLLEALDPDFGVPLSHSGPAAYSEAEEHQAARRQVLLALIERGCQSPDCEVELTDADLAALASEPPVSLPDAFAVQAQLAASDAASLAAGNFTLVAPWIYGPSGARLLGRLCHGDAELTARVRAHLEREAALDPGAIFAEVTASPETDAGLNITHRPVLRDWEIECGGLSGAAPQRRLEPGDLFVAVQGGQVVLWSARHARRVRPRATTAMNPGWLSLPAARFLFLLQAQDGAAAAWSWGTLADAACLPRVRHGRTILVPRQWTAATAELGGLDATGPDGFRRLQQWRERRQIPPLVAFEHPQSPVLVDFGNVLSVDAFLAAVAGLDRVRLAEVAAPSPVRGPEGRYAHELIVPFTRAPDQPPERVPFRPPPVVPEARRRFAPGSDWLYAKLYGPAAAWDRLLAERVGPLRQRLRDAGLIDRWFFIRYADPDRHLRVRFHGHPRALMGEVMPALAEAAAAALEEGSLYRVCLDTYEREAERYGGIEGVQVMEAAAEADSDAVLAILATRPGPAARRHLAVVSVTALLEDSPLDLQARHRCCTQLCQTWASGRPGPDERGLAADYRAERAELIAAVAALETPDPPPGIAALRARSLVLRPVLGRLSTADRRGRLGRPLEDIMGSHAHMFVNRLLRDGAGREELRVHDAVRRLLESRLARQRPAPSAGPAGPTGTAGP